MSPTPMSTTLDDGLGSAGTERHVCFSFSNTASKLDLAQVARSDQRYSGYGTARAGEPEIAFTPRGIATGA